MTIWQRQILSSFLTFFLFAIVLSGFTFVAFPLDKWADLWNRRVMDLPYGLLIITVSTISGLLVGIVQGWTWRRRFHAVDHQLDELVRGNPVTNEESDIYEMKEIENKIAQIEGKFAKQAKLAQRLSTERAEEREKSLQEVVVQERNRLARELHDSVSQQLFAASMMMSAINDVNPPEDGTVRKQMQMVEKMIHQSQLEMRALLLHLRPAALNNKTLSEGAEELLYELTQKVPMDIEWTVESIEVDKGVEDQLFRILQESVSNTLRHAKASTLHVMLIERDGNIILRVVDDGVGFVVEEAKTSSYGLQTMQERAFEVGGTLKIVSLKEEGTRLEVKIPYRKEGGETL
ncbi:sensor histidine kinase [Halobacillus sp. B29]|uniref:sensor histidine kinase n=1 Tax=Halobacillus sp. B29 TaxID=3457432 RepID=UPI003FCC9856